MPRSTLGRIQSDRDDGERRTLRSRIPYQAVEFYLNQLQHRRVLKQAAVADAQGLLLAGVGPRAAQDLLALWGVLEPVQQRRYQRELEAFADGGICVQHRFEIGGTVLTVSGVASTEAAVSSLAPDLRRILSSSWPVSVTLDVA